MGVVLLYSPLSKYHNLLKFSLLKNFHFVRSDENFTQKYFTCTSLYSEYMAHA